MRFWADLITKFCGNGDELQWQSSNSELLDFSPSHGGANSLTTSTRPSRHFQIIVTSHSATRRHAVSHKQMRASLSESQTNLHKFAMQPALLP